jgi:hypothetical protein
MTSGTKLSVVDLRDIREVFPSFRQFHTHLRTHFHRSHISESQLLFNEKNELQKPAAISAAVMPKNENSCKITKEPKALLPMCNENTATPLPPVHRKQISIQQEIMKKFNLEQWVPKAKDIPDFQPPDGDDDVGFFLANHITPSSIIHRGKVEVPPDLDENVDTGQFKLRPRLGGLNRFRDSCVSRWHQNAESGRTHTEASCTRPFSENEIHHVMSLPSKMDSIIQPRALFDAEEYDSTEEIETSHSSLNRALIREQPSIVPPPPPNPPPLLRHTLSQPDQSVSRKSKISNMNDSRPAAPLDDLGTSSNSILDGQGERCIIYEQRLMRTTSIGENSEGTIDNPIRIPSIDYDFVTPARLRKIREFRKSVEADGTSCNIILPCDSMGDESPIRPLRFNFQQRLQNSSIQIPVLETVIDVSESLNISENTSNVSVLIPKIESEKDPETTKSSETQTVTLTTSSGSERCVDANTPCTMAPNLLSLTQDPDGSQSLTSKNCSKNTLRPRRLDPEGFYNRSMEISDPALSATERHSPDISRSHLFPRSWPSSPVSKMGIDFSEVSILDDASRVLDNFSASLLVGKDSGKDLGQKTPSFRRTGPDQMKTMTPQINDCGCLSLSPNASCDEDETAPPKAADVPIRKSTSTGALNELHRWNDMLGTYTSGKCRSRHDHSKSFRAAINMLSKLSPSSKNDSFQRALYVRPKENDEFLDNFLYCSIPQDGHNHRHPLHDELCDGRCDAVGSTACGDVNPGYCCTNILTDALALGLAVPRKHPVTSHKLVDLSGTGIPASKIDPDSWFDMANERFDDVLDHLAGGGGRHRTSSMTQFSFQAPTLKKKCIYGKSKAVVTILDDSKLEEEDGEVSDMVDEKKFDGIGLYDLDDSNTYPPPSSTTATNSAMNDSKHARHLSLMPKDSDHHDSIPHHLNALSDKQFEVMYGMSKEQIEAKAGTKMHWFG